MKLALGITLVFIVLGAALFGSFLMNHGLGTAHSGCLAAAVTGSGSCLQSNILPNFVIGALTAAFLLILFAVLALVWSVLFKNETSGECFADRRETDDRFNSSRSGLLTYLAFHENSPSFV